MDPVGGTTGQSFLIGNAAGSDLLDHAAQVVCCCCCRHGMWATRERHPNAVSRPRRCQPVDRRRLGVRPPAGLRRPVARRRIARSRRSRSSIALRSGVLIVRTSLIKRNSPPSVAQSWHAASRSPFHGYARPPSRPRDRTPVPHSPEAASSRHKSDWGGPHRAWRDPPPSPAPAAPPADLRLQRRIDLPSGFLPYHPLRLSRRSRLPSNQPDGPKIGAHFTRQRQPSVPDCMTSRHRTASYTGGWTVAGRGSSGTD
jgi:hypothetical protein